MPARVILVGTGGWGVSWCKNSLPRGVKEGLIEVVAAVDIVPENLKYARECLGLTDKQCFTDARNAFESVKADICVIPAPPEVHEQLASLAFEYGLDVLSEKPIADSLEGSIRIVQKAESTGRKMGITMSHKYRRDICTLRDMLRSGEYGKLDHLVANITMRTPEDIRSRRDNVPYSMLIEGAVHHLDILEDLAGAECEYLFSDAWAPEWSPYKSGGQALITMGFKNGVRASYEAGFCNATTQNKWGHEYIRAECEKATIIMSMGGIRLFQPVKDAGKDVYETVGTDINLKEGTKWTHDYLLEQFVQWVNGGEKMETNVQANLRSMILVFAAIKSSETRMPVTIDEFVKGYGIK